MRSFLPLLRFHLITGGRLALRAWTPLIAVATVGIGLQADPGASLAGLADALAGAGRPRAVWIVIAIAFAGCAFWAAPRIVAGDRGWIAHLPASRRSRFLALWGALAATLLPPTILLLALAALQAASPEGAVWWSFAAAPLLAIAASGAVVPIVAVPARRRTRVASRASGPSGLAAALPFDARIAGRALGSRILSAWISAIIPLAAAWLFVRNNELPAALERRGAVLGASLALTIAVGLLAEELAARRPAWPWARSLPVGSPRRVRADAIILGTLALPLATIAAAIDPLAALIAAAGLPLLAVRASAALRHGGDGRTAALAPVLAEGAGIAAALTLLPACGLLGLISVPLALRAASNDDRALRVSRWSERHHQAAGDSLSWTD